MMDIQIRRVEYADIMAMRELYRQEANCQIIRDSHPSRGFAEMYIVTTKGRTAGYGTVLNKYDPGRVTEFYTMPYLRTDTLPLFRTFLAESRATHIAAQSNIALMRMLLYDCAENIVVENVLFEDVYTTGLVCPDGVLCALPPEQPSDPIRNWGIEVNGTMAATGGFLTHYNPPYADIHMETAEDFRRQGYGSYLVQEIKRFCYEAGKKPAARCNVENTASRRTLEKVGLLLCGHLLVGEVKP